MVFRFLAIIALSFWGGLLLAQSVPAPSQDSVADLLQAIEQKQFDRVEQILASAHEKLRQDLETPDQLRNRFGVFETTNPDVIEFVSTWRARNPDSIYAKTAQTWVFYAIGSNVRGVKFIRQTYPVALEIHRNMYSEAQDLAMQAFTEDNALISASDAVIVLSSFTGNQNAALEVLGRVMELRPNWGSLTRALDMTNQQYDGSVELADALCNYFGPLIPETNVDIVQACVTWASFVYHGHRRDEIREWMRESESS
ncbi:MAG: hypothetical protein ACI8R4_001282 [Paracoccaceae bacterium]|jgi:hypothetical protein